MTIAHDEADENLWLEEIHGAEPLVWAAEQSRRTMGEFASSEFDSLTGRLLEVIDSDDRIPIVSRRGTHLYNFWRDREHPRGLWRRTTLESYRSPSTDWDVLLDIDALGLLEGAAWVFSGAKLLPYDYTRALVALSPDGGDAVMVREFDLQTRAFVEDGFVVPTAKSVYSWIDRDTIYLGTDFGPGSMTDSSYPRTVRRLRRGQRHADAEVVHEVASGDLEVVGVHQHTPGFERDLVVEHLDFYRSRTLLLIDGELVHIEVPDDADVSLRREWLLVQPRSDWMIGDVVHPTGVLLAIHLDDFLAGDRSFDLLFTPDEHTALEDWDWTDSRLILTLLVDVSSRLESDEFWLHTTGFTTPSSVLRGVVAAVEPEVIRSSPAFFDAAGLEVQQHWAVSDDGTRVPYFQVAARGLLLDGTHPTLLSGYGGFQASRLPDYSGVVGRAWLDRGGVFVLANIRGGGEFGPAWHTAALKANRPRAYEDFAAIARDLVSRGVTAPARLGCEGRSNGGLLVGNMLVNYPSLFGAIVCGVPLLDMKRYTHLSAGASWIAEYGDPDDPAEWEFIRTFSPYHLLRDGVDYPPVLLYAATSDDRVGPVQARKMAARMQGMGIPDVVYYENSDGGHGGAVDNAQTARLNALIYEFLWRRLSG
jgi:prolyl oligopeptidase